MSKKLLGIAGLAAALLAGSAVYQVDARQQALLLRLGEIRAANIGPGLHFKLPIVDSVIRFDTRLMNLEADPERFMTSEKKAVVVDSYVKWRIADAAAYFKGTSGDVRKAGELLRQQINDGLRAEFAKRTVQQVVAGNRSEMMLSVTESAKRQSAGLGIEVVDVRTKKIDLPGEVSNAVYERMRAERERVAREFRSRGAEAAEVIRSTADKERSVVLAEAHRDAERTRGLGDAQAAAIYAQTYGKDQEFYVFYRSLMAYKSSLGTGNDVLLIEPNSDFFRYLKAPGQQSVSLATEQH